MHGQVAGHRLAGDDVQARDVGNGLQRGAHFHVLEVEGDLFAAVALGALGQLVRVFLDRLDVDDQLGVALEHGRLPQAARFHRHAHIVALRDRGDERDGRAEVGGVEAAAQGVGQAGLHEVDDDLVASLAHVDRHLVVRQVDHDAPFAIDALAEIDVLEDLARRRGRYLRIGRGRCDRQAGLVDRLRHAARAVHRDDDGLAVDRHGVVQRALQVEHEAGAFACLHHIDGAQVAHVDVLRGLAGLIGSSAEVQCDAGRVGDGKPHRQLGRRVFHRDIDHHVVALLEGRDRLDRVLLRQRVIARQGQSQKCAHACHQAGHGGEIFSHCDHFLVSLLSCNSSFDMRSTHSPPAS